MKSDAMKKMRRRIRCCLGGKKSRAKKRKKEKKRKDPATLQYQKHASLQVALLLMKDPAHATTSYTSTGIRGRMTGPWLVTTVMFDKRHQLSSGDAPLRRSSPPCPLEVQHDDRTTHGQWYIILYPSHFTHRDLPVQHMMAPVSARGIKSFDFYRKVPLDLTEATWHGGLVSILAMYVLG